MIVDTLPFRHRWDAGYVYIASGHPEGFHKIGRTVSIRNRFRQLWRKQGHPVAPLWAARVRDAVAVETLLHRYFASQRIENEWFRLSAEDIELIKRTLTPEATEVIDDFTVLQVRERRKRTDEREGLW